MQLKEMTPEEKAAYDLRMQWWKWCEENQRSIDHIPTFKDWNQKERK